MKRTLYIIAITLGISLLAFNAGTLSAQEPPHPPTTGHGVTGNQSPPNPNAPIDGGLSIMLALGIAYAAKKASGKQD